MKKENEKLGQDPAFPVIDAVYNLACWNAGQDPTGMSKRFYAACCAMQGLLSNSTIIERVAKGESNESIIAAVAALSYATSDELLKQENK